MIRQIPYKNREEWEQIRREQKTIGGSDAGAVVGLNPYASPYSLWAEKTGRTAPFEGNLVTEVGNYMEDFIAKQFSTETGKKVHRKNMIVYNDKYPWAHANVDRMIVGEKAILECKNTNSVPNMKLLRSGEFPTQWVCQMFHYLAVLEMDVAYLAVMIGGGKEFKWFKLERDEEEIAALMGMEKEFWELVKSDTPPAPIGIDADAETLDTIYPESTGEVVDLMGFGGMLAEHDRLTAQITELDKQRKQIVQQIQQYMGGAETGKAEGYKVRWSNATRRSLDTKAVNQAMPGMLDAFYKETPYRVFKIVKEV